MLLANGGTETDLFDVTQKAGSDIGAAGMVAEILSKLLFVAVLSPNASVDGYLRNTETPFLETAKDKNTPTIGALKCQMPK